MLGTHKNKTEHVKRPLNFITILLVPAVEPEKMSTFHTIVLNV